MPELRRQHVQAWCSKAAHLAFVMLRGDPEAGQSTAEKARVVELLGSRVLQHLPQLLLVLGECWREHACHSQHASMWLHMLSEAAVWAAVMR